jgi:hypothetical protein
MDTAAHSILGQFSAQSLDGFRPLTGPPRRNQTKNFLLFLDESSQDSAGRGSYLRFGGKGQSAESERR